MFNLLFVNRDGLVGDVVIGGRLGHTDSRYLVKSGRTLIRLLNWTFILPFRGQTLAYLGLLKEFLGKQSLKAKEFRKSGCVTKQRS